jgi:hypothetical protein
MENKLIVTLIKKMGSGNTNVKCRVNKKAKCQHTKYQHARCRVHSE